MSRSKGEGRSSGEKGQRLIDPNAAAKRKAQKQEEKEWANKSGPVTVSQIKKDRQSRSSCMIEADDPL